MADAVLVLITALWGATFVVVKDALGDADPFTFLALRFAVGAAALAVLAGKQLRDRASIRSGLILSGFLFAGYAFQTLGLRLTTPSRSAFITGLSVVLVPFVSTVLLRRRPGPWSVLGALICLAGLYGLTRPVAGGAVEDTLGGDLLTLGCTVAYAFHITLTERLAPKAKVLPLVATQLAVVALLSLLCVPLGPPKLEPTAGLFAAVMITGLLASALAISVQSWAQARTTAVRAALIFSLEPVFAAGYSALVGGERFGPREWVGGGLIVGGVFTAEVGQAVWSRLRPTPAPPA